MANETETGDSVCNETDGCPTENAVLKREWRRLIAENAKLRFSGAALYDAIGNYKRPLNGFLTDDLVAAGMAWVEATETPNVEVQGRGQAQLARVPWNAVLARQRPEEAEQPSPRMTKG